MKRIYRKGTRIFQQLVVRESRDETGILVPVRNPGAFADQLDRVINDSTLYNKISRNASAYIRGNHSVEAAAIRYGELYEKLKASGNNERRMR